METRFYRTGFSHFGEHRLCNETPERQNVPSPETQEQEKAAREKAPSAGSLRQKGLTMAATALSVVPAEGLTDLDRTKNLAARFLEQNGKPGMAIGTDMRAKLETDAKEKEAAAKAAVLRNRAPGEPEVKTQEGEKKSAEENTKKLNEDFGKTMKEVSEMLAKDNSPENLVSALGKILRAAVAFITGKLRNRTAVPSAAQQEVVKKNAADTGGSRSVELPSTPETNNAVTENDLTQEPNPRRAIEALQKASVERPNEIARLEKEYREKQEQMGKLNPRDAATPKLREQLNKEMKAIEEALAKLSADGETGQKRITALQQEIGRRERIVKETAATEAGRGRSAGTELFTAELLEDTPEKSPWTGSRVTINFNMEIGSPELLKQLRETLVNEASAIADTPNAPRVEIDANTLTIHNWPQALCQTGNEATAARNTVWTIMRHLAENAEQREADAAAARTAELERKAARGGQEKRMKELSAEINIAMNAELPPDGPMSGGRATLRLQVLERKIKMLEASLKELNNDFDDSVVADADLLSRRDELRSTVIDGIEAVRAQITQNAAPAAADTPPLPVADLPAGDGGDAPEAPAQAGVIIPGEAGAVPPEASAKAAQAAAKMAPPVQASVKMSANPPESLAKGATAAAQANVVLPAQPQPSNAPSVVTPVPEADEIPSIAPSPVEGPADAPRPRRRAPRAPRRGANPPANPAGEGSVRQFPGPIPSTLPPVMQEINAERDLKREVDEADQVIDKVLKNRAEAGKKTAELQQKAKGLLNKASEARDKIVKQVAEGTIKLGGAAAQEIIKKNAGDLNSVAELGQQILKKGQVAQANAKINQQEFEEEEKVVDDVLKNRAEDAVKEKQAQDAIEKQRAAKAARSVNSSSTRDVQRGATNTVVPEFPTTPAPVPATPKPGPEVKNEQGWQKLGDARPFLAPGMTNEMPHFPPPGGQLRTPVYNRQYAENINEAPVSQWSIPLPRNGSVTVTPTIPGIRPHVITITNGNTLGDFTTSLGYSAVVMSDGTLNIRSARPVSYKINDGPPVNLA